MKFFIALLLPLSAFALPAQLDCVSLETKTQIQIRHVTSSDGVLFAKLTINGKTEWVDGPGYIADGLVRNYYANGFKFTVIPDGDAKATRPILQEDGSYIQEIERFTCSAAADQR